MIFNDGHRFYGKGLATEWQDVYGELPKAAEDKSVALPPDNNDDDNDDSDDDDEDQ